MRRSRIGVSRFFAPLLATAGSLVAAPALADDAFVSPGILFSVGLNKPHPFGLGTELSFHTYSGSSFGVGAFTNAIYYFDTASARVALGGQSSYSVLGVEAGYAIHAGGPGESPSHGAFLGAYNSFGLFMVALRGTFGKGGVAASVDFGLKAPFSLRTGNFVLEDDIFSSSGRPHRIDGVVALADVTAQTECSADPALLSGLGSAERKALGRLWLEDARLEHSAVSAFLTLAGELAALGAPPSLVRRAIDAARDETSHTRLCLEAARRHTGLAWTLPAFRPAEPPRQSIDALVRESWEDGCLGEGIAARAACEGATTCSDAWTRGALQTIARDESRHADLAWRILEWCVALPGAAGEEARSALSRAVDHVRGFVPAPLPALKAGTLQAHGRISRAMLKEISDQGLAASRRLARSMLSHSPTPYRYGTRA